MPKHNRNFELTIEDIELIEDTLHKVKRDISLMGLQGGELPSVDNQDPMRRIDDLLGRIHNQKVFYRPDNAPYIGG